MQCIDLKERFSDRWKTAYEPSYYAERGDHARTHDPWLTIVLCRHGHLYPHGGELIGVSTNRRGAITNRIADLPFVRVVQQGGEKQRRAFNGVFHVDHIEEVAAIVKPRRRKLTPEQKKKLAEAGSAFRFTGGAQAVFEDHAGPQTIQPASEVT